MSPTATNSAVDDRPGPRRGDALASRIAWGVIIFVLITGVVGGVHRGMTLQPDWGDLQHESAWTWQNGRTAPGTAMFGYLPTTTFALWPFTVWLPPTAGVVLYVITNVTALLGTLWIVYRWWWGERVAGVHYAWPVLLLTANFQHALQSNQLTLWTLFLCVAGLTLVGRRSPWTGGVVLGLAALIKVMPALLGIYLLLQRRWRALGGMIVAVVAFDVVPSVAVFGLDGAIAEHRAWVRRAGWHSNWHLISDPLLRVHRHGTNSSLAAVLARWLRPVPDAQRQVILYGDPPADVVAQYRAELAPDEVLTLDPMPPGNADWAEKRVKLGWVPRFGVAQWSADVVYGIWLAAMVAGLTVLLWVTWKSTPTEWPTVGALWMLAMFWPSPMTRHYYLAWAFPAVVVVWRALLVQRRMGRRRDAGVALAIAALVAWGIGVICLGRVTFTLRWYGVHLAVLLVLVVATVWAWRVQRVAARATPIVDPTAMASRDR